MSGMTQKSTGAGGQSLCFRVLLLLLLLSLLYHTVEILGEVHSVLSNLILKVDISYSLICQCM